MRFKVLRDNLVDVGKLAVAATAKNSTLPSLGMVALERGSNGTLSLRATDLETSLELSMGVKWLDDEPGGICVPIDFFRYVNKLPKETAIVVDIDPGKREATISTPNDERTLSGLDITEFPLRIPVSDKVIQLQSDLLEEIFARTVYATAPKGAARIALGGVHVAGTGDTVVARATDGFRAAMVEAEAYSPFEFNVNVPTGAIKMLLKLLKVSNTGQVDVAVEDNRVVFDIPGGRVAAQLIDASFPKLAPIWPKSFSLKAEVMPESLVKHIERVTVGLDKGATVILEAFKDGVSIVQNRLQIVSTTPEQNSKAVFNTLVVSGGIDKDTRVGLNPYYFSDALNVMGGSANLCFVDGMTPVQLTENHLGDSLLLSQHLIMPMHLR